MTILRERGIIRGRLGFTFFVYVKSMKNIYIYTYRSVKISNRNK